MITTVADVSRHSVAALVKAGFPIEDARRDVSVLVRHLLDWDTADWLSRQHDATPVGLVARLDALVSRRSLGEPVAYLCGHREFYGRAFVVSPAVLIPRPETELLVERALAAIDDRAGMRRDVPIIDIGTGSGCIAITLAAERPGVRVVATDTSAAALEVARANASRHGVTDRLRFSEGTLTSGVSGVDVVVSNPPYVPERDRNRLMRDVRDFEPSSALFAGEDGLDVIRPLIPEAQTALRPGGTLLLEIGAGQADAVGDLLAAAGFTTIRRWPDLAGILRVVEATTPDGSV